MQNGTVVKISNRWYVRYWEKRNVNGTITDKRVSHCLGEADTRHKNPPADIEKACATFMASVNATRETIAPEHVTSIVEFVSSVYLPWVRKEKRAATTDGYQKIWKKHLSGHFANTLLLDYRPHHATVFLTSLAEKGMGRHGVNHVRALMSGIFKHAAALGRVPMNPIHDAKVLSTPAAPKDTPHYTVMEMAQALSALDGEAKVAMALASVGLRPSEIRGLRWEDVDLISGVIHVRRSAWRGSLNEGGKGKNSVRKVTLGPTLIHILAAYRQAKQSQLGFVLENSAGNPLDLDALAQKTIRPIFAASGLEWKGYYGARRGAETEMNRYTNGDSQITSHHFGHTKAVADAHYIKPLPDKTRTAAIALDAALGEKMDTIWTSAHTLTQ
jgi:integrase